jgi:hypothetical protein
MKQPEPKSAGKDPIKAADSIIELAYGSPDEIEKMSKEEIRAELKAMGVDAEKGWHAMQDLLKGAQGKARLAAAREDRLKATGETSKPGAMAESIQALIEQIKGLVSLGAGDVAVFARKAESMSQQDLVSLRDNLVKTAARAAKKKS